MTLEDQSVFCAFDSSVIYPVPGVWGRMGSTFVNLKKVRKTMLTNATQTTYGTVAPSNLAAAFLAR